MNYDIEDYLNECKFSREMKQLRKIILEDKRLIEENKWGKPTYTYNAANVLVIHEFKDYFAILFNKGILIKDEERRLVQQTPNVHAARHLRFRNMEELKRDEDLVRRYVDEAIEIEDKRIPIPKDTKFDEIFPEELVEYMEENPDFKENFERLTPGRQRGYMLHFADAKKKETRFKRIERFKDRIADGKGMMDKD